MNRRHFLKTAFATAAISLCPIEKSTLEVLANYDTVYVDWRALAREALDKWWQEQQDQMTFEYLTGEHYENET